MRHPGQSAGESTLSPGALIAFLLVAAFLLALTGCGSETSPGTPTASGATYTDIGPDELAALLEDQDVTLVNVHVPYEGEIEGTDLFIDYRRAADRLGDLPPAKDAPIVVYCRTGHMSGIAADVWADAGYSNLYNLTGGFYAWEDAGYPIEQRTPPPTILE